MSGRDQVESLDERLELEEVKDEVLVEKTRSQLVCNDKQQDVDESIGLNFDSKGATLVSADQNDNYLSGIIDSGGLLDDKRSCGKSLEEKNLRSRTHAILAEDANACEDTRKALEDVDAGENVVDAVSTKETGADFVHVVSKPDVTCISDELNGNQLLPDNEVKGANNIQNEIYITDALGSPFDSGKFTAFSDDEESGDRKDAMANDDRTWGDNENMHENNESQNNEDDDITMRSEEVRKTREKLEEDSERTDRKEEIEGLVEVIGSDFESGAVESIEFGEKKDSYGDTSKRGKKIGLIEDDIFGKNAYSEKFQTDISCNENEEHTTSTSLTNLPSSSNGKVAGVPCSDGLDEVEEVHEKVNNFNAESNRGNETNSPKDISPNSNDSSTTESDIENFDSNIRGNFDEEGSEYHSVTSYKYSSFESLDNEETQRNNKEDWILGNKIEKEAAVRDILGSETDRTDDDYVTCDEGGSVVNESVEGCDGDINDYKGYETQEYLTADEQSDCGGEPLGIGGMKEEECATGNDAAKEDEDDRGTIVGSDVEQEELEEGGHEGDVNHVCKPDSSEILNEAKEGGTESENKAEDKSHEYEKTDEEVHEKGNQIEEEEVANNFAASGGEKKVARRKKSFFSSMMAKKEMKITERVVNYNQRYEVAMEGIAQANSRLKQARSDLPLMIVEKRIPKFEELQRKTDKLEQLKTRLDSYIAYNRSANAYIQNWRTKESHIHNKRDEFQAFRKKTSERQKIVDGL